MNVSSFRLARSAAILLFAIATGAALAPFSPASAQTPAPEARARIVLASAGPYAASIAVRPEQPVAGLVHLEARLTVAASDRPVTGAEVRMHADPPAGGERQTSRALNTPGDPGVYVANLELASPGRWRLTLEVTSGGETHEGSFDLDVRARARDPSAAPLGTAVWALISLSIVAGGAWLVYSARRARRRTPAG